MDSDTSSIQGTPDIPAAPVETIEPSAFDLLAERVEDAEARAAAAEKAAAEAQGKTPVYAVYDRTYERFVGNVHETKEKAVKAAKDAKVKSYRVDEVYR